MTTEQLIAAIKLTNNGYIFAPTAEEFAAAQRDPLTFFIRDDAFAGAAICLR